MPSAVLTLQRYAMLTLDSLLLMDRCENCERELAPEWKFCIYCGKPVLHDSQQNASAIPNAIRPEPVEPPRRKYDAPFWVGVGMGVLGLALIIYAAVQIYGSYA